MEQINTDKHGELGGFNESIIDSSIDELFTKKHFNICAFDRILNALNIQKDKGEHVEAYRSLNAIHCMDYEVMNDALLESLPKMLAKISGLQEDRFQLLLEKHKPNAKDDDNDKKAVCNRWSVSPSAVLVISSIIGILILIGAITGGSGADDIPRYAQSTSIQPSGTGEYASTLDLSSIPLSVPVPSASYVKQAPDLRFMSKPFSEQLMTRVARVIGQSCAGDEVVCTNTVTEDPAEALRQITALLPTKSGSKTSESHRGYDVKVEVFETQ